MAIMNYNQWFFNYHKYLKNSRNGIESYDDTKWVPINKRYQKLIDMESELMNEQPFLVQGNNTGFDKLLDLMGRSNYTFEDIDDALGETYRVSLQNAMSRNLVNTHAVLFHTNNLDRKNVAADKFTHYKIIEAPFDQLHFGHRDEFIRQKLQEMHMKAGDYYVDINKFNSSEFVKILNFSIMCTVNGFFCNDCKVAVDDKGFKFKVGWPYASDVDFIVYKLDHTQMFSVDLPLNLVQNKTFISYANLGITEGNLNGNKCIINIYDKAYIKTVPTAPNFGVLTDKGLQFYNVQQYTNDMLTRNKTKTVTVDIYCIKFLHEVPNLYPAINYYDILDSRLVYDERYEKIKTPTGHRVVSSSTNNFNYLETCTPPISLDRDSTYSFNIVINCLGLYNTMISYEDAMKSIGQGLLYGTLNDFISIHKPTARKINAALTECYKQYQEGAILTSLVSSEELEIFTSLMTKLNKLVNCANLVQAQSFEFPELYEFNYRSTVSKITRPFRDDKLVNFENMQKLSKNFFPVEKSTRFNRPISEECFIALKYDRDNECWVFNYPEIKPFHGIGNTFYINNHLTGMEMFKFFVLYSDTEAPSEENIEHFDLNTAFDYDLFEQEVEKHMGCIRYWDAENRIMKISKMIYGKYDEETSVQVLSKMIKRKIDGEDIINDYPSEMNYEESNKTSDYLEYYTETSDRGPFTLNFLFYTLSMLNNNEDKLQAYFYRKLTNNKFNRRYVDINISDVLNSKRFPINYSKFYVSPSRVGTDTHKPMGVAYAFYGLPLLLASNSSDLYEPYRYTLNVYQTNVKYPSISQNGVDETYYTQYDNLEDYACYSVSYKDNIELGRLVSKYLCVVYDYINELQTNYTRNYCQVDIIESGLRSITKHISDIYNFGRFAHFEHPTGFSNPDTIIQTITQSNAFRILLENISDTMKSVYSMRFKYGESIKSYVNKIVLGNLKSVYINRGFDNHVMKRTRMLYLHLKKINKAMNSYEFRKWINGIDYDLLYVLDNCLAANPDVPIREGVFTQIYNVLIQMKSETIPELDALDDLLASINTTFKANHITPLVQYCNEIINSIIFDMYSIDPLSIDFSIEYNTPPAFIVVSMPNDSHVNPPVGTTVAGTQNIIFQPIVDKVGNKYVIKSLANICEYVFFSGTPMSNMQVNILDETGTTIDTQNVTLTFTRICSSADNVNDIPQIINSESTCVEFENGHESFEVVNGRIVNEKHADMNYEMLIGNHFTQLDHEIEYVMEPNTWLQGSIDKVFIENQQINRMAASDYGHAKCSAIYFKPVQVLHLTKNMDGSIDSINGKYFEGETIYLKTVDGLTCFPVKITKVDHSINKGFIEAEVDAWNSRWFSIEDKTKRTQYLTEAVQCEVIDDNMRNFLDEFSDEFLMYNNPGYVQSTSLENESVYTLPGDPIFVSSNSDYVYTRLNYFFNQLVPNRFIDEDHKMHRFIYVNTGFINDASDTLKINMINHNFNEMTLPEQYPVLRAEPNDHKIWDEEIRTFQNIKNQALLDYNILDARINKLYIELKNPDLSGEEIDRIKRDIDKYTLLQKAASDKRARMERYIYQLETPTTWFNVVTYDATLVYIANGRADKFSPTVVPNIRDLVYTDKLEVHLYDWEHKQWLDPSTYTVTTEMVDNVKIDECGDFSTNRVLYTMTITPGNDFVYSNKILVYFSYDKSDVMDDIQMNPDICHVRFKPLITIDDKKENYDPYADIRIRKHFDGYEKYTVDASDIHIKRVKRSGKYTYSPTFRIPDIHIKDENNNEYTYLDIAQFLVPNPMKFSESQRVFHTPKYSCVITAPIDSFQENKRIKLICISNNDKSSYDGNISSIMFSGTTSLNNDSQVVTIDKSTLPNYVSGSFVCTVFQNDEYDPVGGVIIVTVTSDEEEIYSKDWITVPASQMRYREIPKEFKIVMNDDTITGTLEITLKNTYQKSVDDTIDLDNIDDNPFEYYYDTKNLIRYPISDTRTNSHKHRLVIDTTTNTDVTVIKTPYIGICRYSKNRIPENGVIDMTGYLPTPLSRDRYEFWVNGRCVSGDNITILSPTSIQLRNMKSLKNFEVIELVDDINTDNELFKEGNLYIDINGNTFSNYKLALLSNSRIHYQNIMYGFNANVHSNMNDYTTDIIENPNNVDVEEDILSFVTFDDVVTDYEKLYNIPSINGVSLFHPKVQDLGLSEIPNSKIIKKFDEVWKLEAITNPFFMMTHKQKENITEETGLKLHCKQLTDPHWNGIEEDTTGMFLIYTTGPVDKYFSYYISKTSDGAIDDVVNTVKIIPFIMPGVYVLIDKKYHGMWLHATHGQTKPIHIVNLESE